MAVKSQIIQFGALKYQLEFTGSAFNLFYLNHFIGTERKVNAGLVFYGDEPEPLIADLNDNINVFRLTRLLIRPMVLTVGEFQPPQFSLHSDCPRRRSFYRRFGRVLLRYICHLYDLTDSAQGVTFVLNKKDKSERRHLPLP